MDKALLQDPFGLAGTLLEGQYRVDAIVGEGGFGVVYRGRHLSLDQPIAIKVLKGLDGGDPGINALVLEKFRAEARLLYTLSQSSLHIVRALDFGAATMPSGVWAPFMILEWLDGRSLADDLEERRAQGMRGRSLADALAILEPVADGLGVAHEQSVAHRDVKPANIFLVAPAAARHGHSRPGTQVKVLDFGIAKIMKEGESAGTKGTFASFTWLYATPEQLDPRIGTTGLATDVYAFTLLLTELLTDLRPIDEHDVIGIMKAATNPTRRPSPRTRGANIPDEIEAICQRALAVEPKHRFGSLGELWAALSAAHHSGGRVGTAMQHAVGPPSFAANTPRGQTARTAARGRMTALPMSVAAPKPPAPAMALQMTSPPLGTPPPAPRPPFATPPNPMSPPPGTAPPMSPPRLTPPPGFLPQYGASPPRGTAPPGYFQRGLPFVRPDSMSPVVITVLVIVVAMLFAGSCAVLRACN